jgi:HK97 family phage portal protein
MRRLTTRNTTPTETRNVARTVVIGSGDASGVYRQPWDSENAVRQGHARESLVAAITTAVAEDCGDTGRFPFRVIQTGTGKDITATSPLAFAWNVSPSVALSAATLRQMVSFALDYAGECYLVEIGDTWTPLIGGKVEVLTAAVGAHNRDGSPALVAGYSIRSTNGKEIARYDAEGRPVSGAAEGTLHRVFFPYPGHPHRASSLIEQAALPIDVTHYGKRATEALLRNAGQPAGLIQLLDPAIDQDSIDAFDRRVNSRLSDVSQKGRTLVVGADVKYTQLGDSSPGGGWADLTRQAREDVMAVWNIPESRLGRGGARTYENQATELGAYYRHTVVARLNLIASALNRSLRSRGYYLEVDTSAVAELADDNAAAVQQATTLWQAGVATLNEARTLVGLPPVVDGDRVASTEAAAAVSAPRDAVPFDRAADGPHQPTPEQYNEAYDAAVQAGFAVLAQVAQTHHVKVWKLINTELLRSVRVAETRDTDPIPQQLSLDLVWSNPAVAALDDELRAIIPGVVGDVARTVARTLALPDPQSLLDLPVWARIATERVARLVTGVDPKTGARVFVGWNDQLREAVAEAVADGYVAGESMGQVAARIQNTLGVDPDAPRRIGPRAERIARTEMNGLASQSSHTAMVESGVVSGKAWYSIGDGRTRPAHRSAAERYTVANPIPLDARFDVGGVQMMHPGDPTAPAREVVQCRCRTLPVVRR